MTAPSFRLVAATALAVVAIGVSASGVFASGDLASCTLHAIEGDSPNNVGTVLETAVSPAADDVWAMGSHVSGQASSPWAQHWEGTAWTNA